MSSLLRVLKVFLKMADTPTARKDKIKTGTSFDDDHRNNDDFVFAY